MMFYKFIEPLNINITFFHWEMFVKDTKSVQKIRGLFELRGSSWFQENPLGVARFVQINWLKRRFPVADIFICW